MRQLLVYLLMLPAAAAIASDQNTDRSLSLEQAILNVLEHNPALIAAGYESQAAAARIRNAGLTPAFHTSIEFENFGGSGDLGGSDFLETTLSLSKVLELGNKAGLRTDVAQHEALLLRSEQDAQRLDILAEAANRFIQVVSDQEQLAIAEQSLALAQRTHDEVSQRVRAGRSANAELRRAKIALARTQLKFERAQHALETSRLKLATLWGETRVDFASAKADLYAIAQPAPFNTLVERLDNNPDLLRFATAKRLAETRIQLARARNTGNIEIAGGIRHFNLTDDTALVVSLDIPFGNRSRAAPKIEEAEIAELRNPHDREQRRLELYATLFEVHQEIHNEINAVTALRDSIIPLAEAALQDHETGYTAGRYSLLELNVAQLTLLDSKLELVSAAANYHRYRIEIERLTGAGLTTGTNP